MTKYFNVNYREGAFRSPFVYFVSHAGAQALRPITFTQRFRTTRHLISIQLLWKPKILNVEDKRTKFERSKGDLGQFSESYKKIFDTSVIEQTHWFALFLRSWWIEVRDIPAGLRQSVISLMSKPCTDMLFQPNERLHFENSFVKK